MPDRCCCNFGQSFLLLGLFELFCSEWFYLIFPMHFKYFYVATPFATVSSIVTKSNMLLTPLVGARVLQTRSMPRQSTFRNCCSHHWFWLCFELFINIMDLPTSLYFRICCYFHGQSTIFDNNNNIMKIVISKLLLSPSVLATFVIFN